MAENESLDLRLSRRWVSVLKLIIHRESPDRISQRVLKTLQAAWRNFQKQLQKYGTSLEEITNATIDQKDLDALYRQTKRHDYVKLFEAEQQSFDSPGQLIERVVCHSLERILDQIRDKIVGSELCPNQGQWRNLRDSLLRPISGEIAKFADRLASRPNIAIRVVDTPVLGDLADPSSFIHLSLLNTIPTVLAGARS